MKKAITILAPSFVLTSIVAVASGLSSFATAFPELPLSVIQLLTSLPSLVGMPVILLSGLLCARFSKKQIVTVSMLLMIAGGLGPILFHQRFSQLVTCSILFGLGYGGISPLTTALIQEHFPPKKQPVMLGYQSAVIGIGGAVFSFLGGRLAAGEWWHTYFTYLLFLPVLAAILLQPAGEPHTGQSAGLRGLFRWELGFYLLQSVLFAMLFFTFQNNVALLLTERKMGNSTISGRVLAVQSIVGIISGILGGRILFSTGKFALPGIFLVSGSAMLLIFFGRHVSAFYCAAALLGFVFSLRMPAGYLKATASVSPALATMATAVYCSSSSLGQFLSPLFINALAEDIDVKFIISAVTLLAVGLLSLVFECRKEQYAV